VKLRDRRPRDEAGVFLVEGYREIRRALEKGVKLAEIYFSPEWFLGENEPALIAQAEAAGAKAFELTKEAFAKVAYRERPDGLLAVAPQWKRALTDLTLPAAPFLLVVEAIEKPGNLGAILRTADAAGLGGVIVCDARTDVANPAAIRASLGTVFAMPVATSSTAEAIEWCGRQRRPVVAATPEGTRLWHEADLHGNAALVLGSEAHGLSAAWTAAAAGGAIRLTSVRLPMHGIADSLNLSVTAAVLAYESVRQREQPR